MTSPGKILRKARESQGRRLEDASQTLCITKRYLQALEDDKISDLPGIFFYKSFIRQYAMLLGLTEKEWGPAVEAMLAPEAPPLEAKVTPAPVLSLNKKQVPPPRPAPVVTPSYPNIHLEKSPLRAVDPIVRQSNLQYFPERQFGASVAVLAVVLLLCSGFYAWWNRAPQPASETVVTQVAPAPTVLTPDAETSRSSPSLIAQNTSSSDADQAAPTIHVTTSTAPDGTSQVVLTLAATEQTWLSITSGGKRIFSGVLQASQTKTLTGLQDGQMKVGNAGGIEVEWNGKPIGPIGPRGQVRVVKFNKDNVEILSTDPDAKSTL